MACVSFGRPSDRTAAASSGKPRRRSFGLNRESARRPQLGSCYGNYGRPDLLAPPEDEVRGEGQVEVEHVPKLEPKVERRNYCRPDPIDACWTKLNRRHVDWIVTATEIHRAIYVAVDWVYGKPKSAASESR